MSEPLDVESFVNKQLDLINSEREAEKELVENQNVSQLKRSGSCLTSLHVLETETGLAGRWIWVMGRHASDGSDIPRHSFRNGDSVAILPNKALKQAVNGRLPQQQISLRGVICRVKRDGIHVVLDSSEPQDDEAGSWAVVRTVNDVPYRRMTDSLNLLKKYSWGPAVSLREALLGIHEPSFDNDDNIQEYFNPHLNDSQKKAVSLALRAKDFALVHGPPGTGKSSTTIEIIKQAVKRGEKVLACAPSNIAVDNLVERLAGSPFSVVRPGHPARLLQGVQHLSLDAQVQRSDDAGLVRDMRKEVKTHHSTLAKTKGRSDRRAIYTEIRTLNREIKQREEKAVQGVLSNAPVVLCTLTGAADRDLKTHDFDLVVIDECTQATEALCWAALLKGKRCVLVGDPKQLPPTIKNTGAAKAGLERTLFQRLHEQWGKQVTRLLNIQYRMHEKIMNWSSSEFYDNALVADASVKGHLLRDLGTVGESDETTCPLVIVNTLGCDMYEQEEEEGDSLLNTGEADLVCSYVKLLLEQGLVEDQIAVITPYAAQVRLLTGMIVDEWPGIEVGTIDGFQGREKEVVILSCVRSNPDRNVGFLADERRMNVAVTRARRHLCVICDSETLERESFLARLVEYCEENGEYYPPDTLSEA